MRRLLLALALALFAASPARAQVAFAANGNTTVTAGTGTCTPSTTTLGTVGATDIVILVATGEHDRTGITLSTARGFVEIPGSPQFGGDGDATEENPEIGGAVFWVRGSDWTAAPVVADSGDHTSCALHRFTGAATTGNPWDVTAAGNDSNANDTSALIPGSTTTVVDTLVVLIQGTSNNATSTANCGAVTNASLGSITERFDSSSTSGLGGGHCIITGTKATAGAYSNSTLTMSATTYKAAWSIALRPEPAGGGGTIQRVAGQSAYGRVAGAASLAVAFPGSVTSGNLLVLTMARGSAGGSDPMAVGDISQSAGTATLGSFQLDRGHEQAIGGSNYQNVAIYSVPVTGTGSCTLSVGGGAGADYWGVAVQEYSGADTSASRVNAVNSGVGTSTTVVSGTAATGGDGLLVGAATLWGSSSISITPQAAWAQVAEEEDGSLWQMFASADQSVASDTTDEAEWTLGSSLQFAAAVVAYKIPGGGPSCSQSIALMGVGCR